MKNHRGHAPKLADPAAKLEQRQACGDRCKRGEKWLRPCPSSTADRHPTPVVVDPRAVHVVPEGRYFGRTKDGG